LCACRAEGSGEEANGQHSFVSKVMSHVTFGFAAGCEGAVPDNRARLLPGYALGPGFARRIYWAKGRTKGLAQKCKWDLYGGA